MKFPMTVPMVIHRHNAYRAGLHFDWRFKYPDKRTLISFVIPKNKFPKLPGTKTIAIQAPDHGMHWLKKDELRIPAGEYGGGVIQAVQKGTLDILVWKKDYIVVEVKGEFADGRYYFVNTKRIQGTRRRNTIWILLKKKESEELLDKE